MLNCFVVVAVAVAIDCFMSYQKSPAVFVHSKGQATMLCLHLGNASAVVGEPKLRGRVADADLCTRIRVVE